MDAGILSPDPSSNAPYREEDQDRIEETLSNAIDFLAAESAAESTMQKDEPYSTEILGRDDDCILRPEQLELLDRFRRTLLCCKTDTDRFQVCAEWRDNILTENTSLQYFVAEVEHNV